MEVTDQTQTLAVSESPATEIPPQAATETPEPQTPEPQHPEQDEAALTAEIAELWRLHSDYKSSIKDQNQNLISLRAELGKRLAEMKQVLAKPGRSGGWSGWLKECKISRATADRLVIKYERSLNPDSNCLTAQFTEPTEAEIQTLLDKLAPKLRRVLRTPTSVYRFIELLASSIALDRKHTEEGFVILRPAQPSTVVDSVLADSPMEPTPPIIDVAIEASSAQCER